MQKLEEELQRLMENKSGSVRAFAIDNEIPYTTLKSMLSRGVMATNVSNVITICKALGIRPESLGEDNLEFSSPTIIHGNNHGIASMSGNIEGNVTFSNTQSKDSICREQEVADNSTEDLDIQKAILVFLERQTKALERLEKQQATTHEILEEILDEVRKYSRK